MNVLCITPVKHIYGVMNILESCGRVEYEPYATQVTTRVKSDNYEAIFTNPNKMTYCLDDESIGKVVKVICTASTGTNYIDMDYCEKRGIEVLSLTTDYDVIKKISSTADVVSDELGNIKNSPIINRVDDLNIIVTPHIGGMTKEAQEIAYIAAANKLIPYARS